jgi:tetratricopeptide (TPR) repeat protein
MSRYIEDLKIDREHLYKQLELSHDREKMALLREQQDFKRIESLENQLVLLPAPGSREMKIINPDQNTYDTDVKPVIGVVATEAEVKDEKEIYAEIQDEYKKASEEDQHPDEAPVLNESSDLDVVFDLHDEIDSGESSDFVKKERRDYPDVDKSVEKPAERTDHKASINAEKDKAEREKPEEEKIDKTDNEKANRVTEPFVPTEDEEEREPETPVELQDLRHIESADSSAAARLDDIIEQNLLEESTAKGDDESSLADDPVPKYMALGQEALKKEDYDNAIECFLKVVDILPTAGTVVLNLADLYFLKKEYEAARKYAAQALELGEEGATVVLDKINAVIAPDAGMPSVEKNREEVAEDVTARKEGYKKGSEEIALESDDYAKPHTKAAEQEPEQEIVDELQDTIWIELDALNEAIDSTEDTAPGVIEDAVSKDDDEKIDQKKDDARKYTSLGVEAAGQKDYYKAIEHFSKAVEILPDNAAGFCNLAVLNYRLKEYETAYRDAQKAIYLGSPSATQILEKIKLVMVADLKSTEGFEPAVEIGKNKSSQVARKDEGETFFIESDAVTLDEFMKTEKQKQSDSAVDASLREKDAFQ